MFIKKGLQEWSLNPSSSTVGDIIIIIIIIVYLNSEMQRWRLKFRKFKEYKNLALKKIYKKKRKKKEHHHQHTDSSEANMEL